MNYKSVDGWVYSSITNGCDLDSIISYGDVINHSIFNYDELNDGLNRLITDELIRMDNKLFYRVDNQNSLVKKFKIASKSARNGLFKISDIFEEFVMYILPDYTTCVITKEEYNSSIDNYRSLMNNLLKKYIK